MSAQQPIIIIKRPKKVVGGGHHGGAWKVAYADFVTAMMAFFLLMWLLNATTEDQRRGIADYFNPSIPIAAVSGGGSEAIVGGSVTSAKPTTGVARTEGKSTVDLSKSEEEMSEALTSALVGDAAELSEHISVRMSPEGLVIELTDREKQPLFASGSSTPSPVLRRLSTIVAQALDAVQNDVKIVGHTDSNRFVGSPQGYTNWELSSDRANVARRLMKGAGLPETRITEVSGRAATMPLVENPLDPRNRRISITLLSTAS